MPWKETRPMDERSRLIASYETGVFTVTELCLQYGISRKTAYKWIGRFHEGGYSSLQEQSRAPAHCPHRTPAVLEKLLEALRRAHPTWGSRKLLARIAAKNLAPGIELCSAKTSDAVLARANLIKGQSRSRRPAQPGCPPVVAGAPNAVWFADFKGDFRMGDGQRCYPLTVSDAYSRTLLCCTGLPSVAHAGAQHVFELLFKEVGLPEAIRTDNGGPFCSHGLCGLSRLSALWLKLGIVHQRIKPASPQENGIHERMHRVLKAEACRPPAGDMAGQQVRFDAFRKEFNEVRPHEAIGMMTPSDLWHPSNVKMPMVIPEHVYPGHMEVRRVRHDGMIKFRGRTLYLSEVLIGERVALEETDDGIWSLYFMDKLLGRLRETDWELVRAHR